MRKHTFNLDEDLDQVRPRIEALARAIEAKWDVLPEREMNAMVRRDLDLDLSQFNIVRLDKTTGHLEVKIFGDFQGG